MLSDAIRELARTHALVPQSALRYAGQLGPLTLELELDRVPAGFGAKLMLSPREPHGDLFATARPLWLLGPEGLLLTGDPSFDAGVALRAPPMLLGLFDHAHRHGLLRAIASGEAHLEAGRLIATLTAPAPGELDLLVAFGQRLCFGRDEVEAGLAVIASSDPHAAVRERARLVLSRPPAPPLVPLVTASSARAQAADPYLDTTTRVSALATLIRERPWSEAAPLIAGVSEAIRASYPHHGAPAELESADSALEGLLEEINTRLSTEDLDASALTPLLTAGWAKRADLGSGLGLRLAELCARLPRPEHQPSILRLLNHPSREVRLAAMTALDAADLTPEALLDLLTPERHLILIELAPELAATAGRGGTLLEAAFRVSFRFAMPAKRRVSLVASMRHLSDPRVEPFLWDRLEDGDSETREAALDALGACGTHASLPRLAPLSSGFFRSSSTRERASAAIAHIIARLGPGGSGALALSSPEAGGLALDTEP